MNIKVKLLKNAASQEAPSRSTTSIPLLCAIEESATLSLAPMQRAAIPTGIALELPEGVEALVTPFTSLVNESGVTVLNNPGTIDPDYRGEVFAILINFGSDSVTLKRGQQIAELRIREFARAEFIEVKELGTSARGSAGLGSTGQ